MPTARFDMPNGRTAEFNFPEGTTPEQAQSWAANWWKSQGEAAIPQSPFKTQAQETGPLQALAVGAGRGFMTLARGVGLAEPETPFEQQAMTALKAERPYTTGAGELLAESAPFVIPGVAVGGLPGALARILGGAAVGGASGGIIAKGKGENVVAGAGTGAVLGGTFEALAPYVGSVLGRVYQKVMGKAPVAPLLDAAGNITPEMTDVLKQAGLSVDDVATTAIKESGASAPEEAARLARAAQEGVPLSTGEVTQNFAQQATEQRMLGNAGEAASEQFRQFKLNQSQAIKKNLETAVPFPVGKEEAGGLIVDALTGRRQLLRTQKNALYKSAGEAAADKGGIPIFTDGIESAIPNARELKDLTITAPGPLKQVNDLLESYGLKAPSVEGLQVESLNLENVERFRKSLNVIERSDQSGAVSVVTKPVKAALDTELDALADNLALQGVPDNIVRPLREARATVRQMKTEFSPQSLVGKLTGMKPDGVTPIMEASKAYDSLVIRSQPVENVRKVVLSLKAAGEQGEQGLAAIRTTTMMDLIEAGFGTESRKISGIRTFNPIAFRKRIDAIGKDKVKAIFEGDPKTLTKIFNIEKIAADLVPPDRAMVKGSGDQLWDIVGKMGLLTLAQKMPGGGFVVEAIKRPVEAVKTTLAARTAMAGTPSPAPALSAEAQNVQQMFVRTFPGIAAAMGVSLMEE